MTLYNTTLTRKQREILVGCILGDLHLRTNNNGKSFSCYFEQGGPYHKEYLFHLYDCFKNLCTSKMEPRPAKIRSWRFETKSLATLAFYGNLFYTIDVQTGKRVKRLPTRPNLLKKFITPVSLAYWFMDDGSQKSKGLFFNTHGFTLKEVELLCDILKEKFDLKAKPRKTKHLYKEEIRVYYQIYISGHSFETFHNLVYREFIPSMLYLLSPRKPFSKKVEFSKGLKSHLDLIT